MWIFVPFNWAHYSDLYYCSTQILVCLPVHCAFEIYDVHLPCDSHTLSLSLLRPNPYFLPVLGIIGAVIVGFAAYLAYKAFSS